MVSGGRVVLTCCGDEFLAESTGWMPPDHNLLSFSSNSQCITGVGDCQISGCSSDKGLFNSTAQSESVSSGVARVWGDSKRVHDSIMPPLWSRLD